MKMFIIVTLNAGGHNATGQMVCHEISGVATASLDGTAHSIRDQTSVTTPTTNGIISNSITTSAADYIFSAAYEFAVGGDTWTAGTTPNAFTYVGTNPAGLGSEYFVQSSSGILTSTMGSNRGSEFYVAIIAFKPPSAGGVKRLRGAVVSR